MSNQELVDVVKKLNFDSKHIERVVKNHYPEILSEIQNRTKFLDGLFKKVSLNMRLYCIQNNFDSVPICSHLNCKHRVKWGKGCFT